VLQAVLQQLVLHIGAFECFSDLVGIKVGFYAEIADQDILYG